MLRSGGAVIHMKHFDSLQFIIGNKEILGEMQFNSVCMKPFADETIDFLDCWSKEIRNIPEKDKNTAVSAFGFWCRRAGLKQISEEYKNMEDFAGRGLCLQFVPSNIPALFAYSLAAGLLAGNVCAVRLPSRKQQAAELLCAALNRALEIMPEWKKRIVIIRYPHDKAVTDELSAMCRTRVIWGGDSSVSEIRKSPLKGAAKDITFPSRHSMAVFDAEAVNAAADLTALVRSFYNDTYLNDQNACSSPSVICWLGGPQQVDAARERFWKELRHFIKERYKIQAESTVKKTEAILELAAAGADIRLEKEEDNLITRIWCNTPEDNLWDYMVPGGLFAECRGIPEALLTSKCQTISCFGISCDDVKHLVNEYGSFQVVQTGHTLDFNLVWDGTDLIREMCCKAPRELYIPRGGWDLFVRVRGNGPALLMIHGVATDCDFYDDSAELLEDRFTVITYDRVGYSRSRFRDGYTEQPEDSFLDSQIKDAEEILRELGIKDAAVAGCSAGGVIAIELSRRNPALVNRLFLYEAAYAINPDIMDGLEKWKMLLSEAAEKHRVTKAMLSFINAIGPQDKEAPEKSLDRLQQNMVNLERFLYHELDVMLDYSKENQGIIFAMPVLCGVGALDKDTIFYKMLKESAAGWKAQLFEMEGSHNLAEDRPVTFAGWIKNNIS